MPVLSVLPCLDSDDLAEARRRELDIPREVAADWGRRRWRSAEGRHLTVIRYGDRVIWSERACYEGGSRFEAVAEILKAKYGQRLVDLVPTDASELYLYGDDLSSIRGVEEVRKSLKR